MEWIQTVWDSPWGIPAKVLLVIGGALVLRLILKFVIDASVRRIVSRAKRRYDTDDTVEMAELSPIAAIRRVKRARALGSVFKHLATAIIIIVAVLLIVFILFPDVSGAFALLTAVLGAGLGFGAQNLIKDILNGILIVSEDQFGIGDVIDTGLATGVVEDVGIRVTQVRDVNGTLWFVRNGEILRVGNMSHDWSRVVVDLAVPYESDVDQVQQVILDTAQRFAADPSWAARLLEAPELWGIESISGEAIVERIVVKTRPSAKDDVARELRARLKTALDDIGVRPAALNTISLRGIEGVRGVARRRKPPVEPDGA